MSVVHFVVSFFATGHCVVLLLNFLSTALSLIRDAVLQARMIKNIPTVLFFVLVVVVHVLYSVVDLKWQDRISVGFKLAVRDDSGAGGLVAPLHCTAYFGKLAKLFGCSLPQQALA